MSNQRKKMKMKKIMNVVLLGMLIILFAGCSSSSDEKSVSALEKSPSAKSITEFSLNGDVGTINEAAKTIKVSVPYGTSLTNMVATFTTTGSKVEIDGTEQISDATANDFTSPVIYTVTAINATTQNYTVTVTVAAKSITEFSLNGDAGTINEAAKTIKVSVPSGTSLTNMVATFTTTGSKVEIDGTQQISGTTANDFTSPVVYTVKAVDDTTRNYTVTVVNEVANEPATAISVSMTPVNDPRSHIPEGVFNTASVSITGSYVVTDTDGGSVIVTEWYDNDVLIQSNTTKLPSGATSGKETLKGPFHVNNTITFKATVDGVPSNTASAIIICRSIYN